MSANTEKRIIKSRGNDNEQAMTEAEFKKFAAVVDPNGQRFYDAGPFTPPEAEGKGKPVTTPRNRPGTSTPTTVTGEADSSNPSTDSNASGDTATT